MGALHDDVKLQFVLMLPLLEVHLDFVHKLDLYLLHLVGQGGDIGLLGHSVAHVHELLHCSVNLVDFDKAS